MDYQQHITKLQTEVNRAFGRTVTSVYDFEQLAEKIQLSVQTLRRFYGKIDKDKQLSTTSLNLICNYIGYADWQSFCNPIACSQPNTHSLINAFYDTVAFSGATFFDQKLRDTHEAYAELILKDIPYAYSFLERYKAHPVITQSLYPWFPYYDQMAHPSYVQLIEHYLTTNPLEHLRVCQNSFLAYGAFFASNGETINKVEKYVKNADKHIESIYKEYPDSFFHYPETRYTIAKIIQAHLHGDENQVVRIAEAALNRNLSAKPLHVFGEYFHTPDILISKLCNALIWMGKIDFATEIYKSFSKELFLSEDPVEHQSKNFVYERDTNFAAQTVEMLHLFDDSIPLLESKRQPHWKTQYYEEIQQYLIALKRTKKTKLSQRHAIKEQLQQLAKKLNYGIVDNIIKIFS